MSDYKEDIHCELAVIGAGMAGMAASLFAANKKLSVVQCGSPRNLAFSSGLLDLMGIYPIETGRKWSNPWEAIDSMKSANSGHPYTKTPKNTIENAFNELIGFFRDNKFNYHCKKNTNSLLPTSQGTIKASYFIPQNMWNGSEALANKQPCLLVDFKGLREFSAMQIKENLNKHWPGLRCLQIDFPGNKNQGELYPEQMARALENPGNLKELAEILRPHLDKETFLGLPAILGIYQSQDILQALESELGVSIFEIPTPTVSVSGLRIKELFRNQFPNLGITQLENSRVIKTERLKNGSFKLYAVQNNRTTCIMANAVILASGRFFSGGLKASRSRIDESVFNLPVVQPDNRSQWHSVDFFDKKGHLVNQSGLEVDDFFRPLNPNNQPVHKNLFAAGSILAHQDWIREKSGSGIAISSAYSAVNSVVNHLQS